MTAQIKIRRSSSALRSSLKMEVYIDLENKGEVKNGETKAIYVAPGTYRLRLVHHILNGEWRSPSIKFKINDGDTLLFEGGFTPLGLWLEQQ